MLSPIKPERQHSLPEAMRHEIREARQARGWSQAELGRRVGLPQMHISGIESGKIVPRYSTLLDLVRVLGFDLALVPRALVPAVRALIEDHRHPETSRYADEREHPLYGTGPDERGRLEV
jgi:transcriptional regulator with XRE-family HTH domain